MLPEIDYAEPRSLPKTGVHLAYCVELQSRKAIGRNLAVRQIDVYTYKKDRSASTIRAFDGWFHLYLGRYRGGNRPRLPEAAVKTA